ncbi:hypothetical protein GQ55_1G127100 [Panicum hallii var. hallii]|uniref:Uncharacterized protein n=1 Tax=Panicum hallii var. hallii TaxID=1504633 RepID=A0A2T7F4Z2_9POAL|nr:hypothetical protein GQ55_1G127100 [Panicum hallii var. hallii]
MDSPTDAPTPTFSPSLRFDLPTASSPVKISPLAAGRAPLLLAGGHPGGAPPRPRRRRHSRLPLPTRGEGGAGSRSFPPLANGQAGTHSHPLEQPQEGPSPPKRRSLRPSLPRRPSLPIHGQSFDKSRKGMVHLF